MSFDEIAGADTGEKASASPSPRPRTASRPVHLPSWIWLETAADGAGRDMPNGTFVMAIGVPVQEMQSINR